MRRLVGGSKSPVLGYGNQVHSPKNTHPPEVPPAIRRVLIIVENLPVPFDRRVWRECVALRRAGYDVSVIAPRDEATRELKREIIDGVSIYRFKPFQADGGFLSYLIEYLVALASSFWLSWVVLWRKGFDVIQICNPPDIVIFAVVHFKLFGKRIIFDQHDLCPEIYQAQKELAPNRSSWVLRILLLCEHLTYRLADAVLVVNESCRRVALQRGGKHESKVFIVRNGPTAASIQDVREEPDAKHGKRFLLTYVGMMGPQEGIDVMLRSIHRLRKDHAREDFHVRIIGDGTVFGDMIAYAKQLQIDDVITFTGRLDYPGVLAGIASADVCLCPDPKTSLSDKCSLVKSIEYMSLGRPFVAFDLEEVRLAAGDAALYAESGDEMQFAACVNDLLNNPLRRAAMGAEGKRRVLEGLTWDRATESLHKAYESAFASHSMINRSKAL